MYASDQGFFLGDHGWFDKRFMYEQSVQMPFLLSYPRGIPAGGTQTGIVTNVDVAQKILDAAGVDHPRMQGRSFWADLTGRSGPPPAEGLYYRYWEHDDPSHQAPARYGYRTERHKLIYFYTDGLGYPGCGDRTYPPEWELYDLEADPEEVRNVADDPAYAAVRERLEVALWRAQADVPHPSQPVPRGVSDLGATLGS